MKKLLLLIVLVAVSLVAALPAGIGWLVQSQAEQWAEQFNADNPQWQLSLQQYQRGWWRSQAHWQLQAIEHPASHPLARDLALDIHQDVFHGPFANTDNGARWALLTAQSRIGGGWSEQAATLAADSQVVLGLDLVLSGELEWQAFAHQNGQQKLQSQAGKLDLHLNFNENRLQLAVDVGAGEYRLGENTTRWQSLKASTLRHAGQSLEADIHGRDIAWAGNQLGQGELRWRANGDDNGLWHHQLAVSANALEMGENQIERLELQGWVEQLHAAASLRIVQAMMEVERAGLDRRGSNNARLAVLLQHLPAVLEARPRLGLEPLIIDSELGQLQINGQANLDQARPMHLASPFLLEQGAQLQASIEVDRSMLSELLIRRYQSQAGEFRRGENDSHLYRRLAEQQIDTWLQAGLLQRKGERLVSEVDLARGGWLINQQPWIRGLQ